MRSPFTRKLMAGFGELCPVLEIASQVETLSLEKYSKVTGTPVRAESGLLGQWRKASVTQKYRPQASLCVPGPSKS